MRTLKTVKHVVIYKDEQYNTFPSMVVNKDGQIMVGFRQAPDRRKIYGGIVHVDPSSKAVYVVSPDGERWTSPARILYDDYFCGVQDPCLNVLRDGTLFATFFMWKVAEREEVQGQAEYDHEMFGRWAGKSLGAYSIRSSDGGKTWDRPISFGMGGVYIRGNCVELDDGSILAPLYGNEQGSNHVIVAVTRDRGATWKRQAVVPPAEGYHFNEPNLYRTESGRLVLFIRSLKKRTNPDEKHLASPLFTCESPDNGRTWSRPVMHDIYSPSPFHLLRLNSGHVLMTYGYRLKPYGIRALVLDPECREIRADRQIIVREDGPGLDIGYTTAVQLADDRVLIAYYYYDEEDGYRYIAGSICALS